MPDLSLSISGAVRLLLFEAEHLRESFSGLITRNHSAVHENSRRRACNTKLTSQSVVLCNRIARADIKWNIVAVFDIR